MPAGETVNDNSNERVPRAYKKQPITVSGVEYGNLAAAARARGLDYQAVRHLIRCGYSPDVAFGVHDAAPAAGAPAPARIQGRVYKIVHTATGKVYVGRTSAKVGMRWRWHIHKALKAKKVNPLGLPSAIREFGEHAFEVTEIGTATSLEDLTALEARYILELNSLAPTGFNLSAGDSLPAVPSRRSAAPKVGSLRIGQLAAKAACDVETVRFYERLGLLPQTDRTVTGGRLYSESDLPRLNLIRYLRSMDMALPDIKKFLEKGDSDEGELEAASLLDSQLALVERRLSVLRTLKKRLVVLRGTAAIRARVTASLRA